LNENRLKILPNEYYKVAELFSDSECSSFFNDMQASLIKKEFDIIVQSKSPKELKEFMDSYRDVPDKNGYVKQAEQLYEYYVCLNSSSIDDKANYAKKHPEKYKEMENLAFKLTSSTESDQCADYLRYFPDGEHVSIVQERYRDAKQYDYRKEQERLNTLCYTCHGNGNCSNCNGYGEASCYNCHGTGIETTGFFLFGTEEKICSDCKGRGRYRCYKCSGNGRCSHCKGSRYQYR
jgi:hypothetical protein